MENQQKYDIEKALIHIKCIESMSKKMKGTLLQHSHITDMCNDVEDVLEILKDNISNN